MFKENVGFYVEVSLLQLDGHVFLDTELLVPYIG